VGAREAPRNAERLAYALGWFSLALGVAEVVAPRRVGRLAGLADHRTLLRVFGLREIASGLGILAQQRPAGWVWGRVAGDVMDLALVGAGSKSDRAGAGRLATAAAALAGVMLVDVLCGFQLGDRSREIVRR
jgi:hypothetical protein